MKQIAKNLLNNRVCENCKYHTFEVQDTIYESGKEGEIKIDECLLAPELDLYGIADKYTCEKWEETIRPSQKNYFSNIGDIQNPVQGQIAINTKTNQIQVYDGFKWTNLP